MFVFRATLDLNLRHINLDKKTQHELHSRKAREKDRDLRNLKKAELQLRVAQDAAAHTQTILEKFEGQVCWFLYCKISSIHDKIHATFLHLYLKTSWLQVRVPKT